jgi:hypothetical protein
VGGGGGGGGSENSLVKKIVPSMLTIVHRLHFGCF